MKTIIQSIALFVGLLVVLESCTVQDHLIPAANPYANCLLKEERDVDLYKISQGEEIKIGDTFPGTIYSKVIDIIEIDGQKYALSSAGENRDSYKYDAEKRVIEHSHYYRFVRGLETYSYEYAPGKITEKFVHEGWPSETRSYTYTLNEYGFIPKKDVVYNSEGYVIENEYGMKVTITDGNGTKTESSSATSIIEFDLTRLNIPNPLPFYGKTDRNLMVKLTTTYTYGEPTVANAEYKYQFDSQGKVVRRIRIQRNSENPSIQIVDYDYECQ